MVSNETCRFTKPFFGCWAAENGVLGLLYLFGFFACIYCIFFVYRSKKKHFRKQKLDYFCPLVLGLWMFYRFLICFIPFEFASSIRAFFTESFSSVLFMIGVELFILRICELLFIHGTPAARLVVFFRTFFFMFGFCYSVIGILLSIADYRTTYDISFCISLWEAAIDYLITFFYFFPILRLFNAITHSSNNFSDLQFVRQLKWLSGVFVLLLLGRGIFNTFSFFQINYVELWLYNNTPEDSRLPHSNARAFSFFFYLIFDLFPGYVIIFINFLIKKHDDIVYTDPFFIIQESDQAFVETIGGQTTDEFAKSNIFSQRNTIHLNLNLD